MMTKQFQEVTVALMYVDSKSVLTNQSAHQSQVFLDCLQ